MNNKAIPNELSSPGDKRALSHAIARHKISAMGVYLQDSLAALASGAGIAFVIALDVEISNRLGEHFFSPIPGQADTSIFGAKTILAGTLLSAGVLHLASDNAKKLSWLHVINEWAPKFALVYIGGAAALLISTMGGQVMISPSSGWDEEVPLLSELITGLHESLINPLSQTAFAIGFGSVLFSSVFALSKLGDWMAQAIKRIVDKFTRHKPVTEAAARIKRARIEYRQKAAEYNAACARLERDNETAFALMVYQSCAAVISEAGRQVSKKPEKQYASYRSSCADISRKKLKAFKRACRFKNILAAVRGKGDTKSKPRSNRKRKHTDDE